jgi:tetratricopeptide (TPR) repeat protein
MRELAPSNATGHPRAHYWVAKSILQGRISPEGQGTELLIHHLERALASHHDRLSSLMLLASIRRDAGDLERSAEHLADVVSARPEMRLPLAVLYRQLGDTYLERREIKAALKHFRQQLDADEDDVEARIYLSQAVALGGDFEQAEALLLMGLKRAATQTGRDDHTPETMADARLDGAVLDLYLAWYQALGQRPGVTVTDRLEILAKALERSPKNAAIIKALAALANEPGDPGKTARDLLEAYPDGEQIPPAASFVLGTLAAQRGDFADAEKHLEIARTKMPRDPALLNNLAWVVAHLEPPQLDRALQLADDAQKLAPGHPEIMETRGNILVGLERWSEALTDLEIALQQIPDRPGIHEQLGIVYEQLGNPELAKRHRTLAERLQPDN